MKTQRMIIVLTVRLQIWKLSIIKTKYTLHAWKYRQETLKDNKIFRNIKLIISIFENIKLCIINLLNLLLNIFIYIDTVQIL